MQSIFFSLIPNFSFLWYAFLPYACSISINIPNQKRALIYLTPSSTACMVFAALCDADGCLGLDGFMQAMHDQIRTFTKSSLADTSRLLPFPKPKFAKLPLFSFQILNDDFIMLTSFQNISLSTVFSQQRKFHFLAMER